MTSEARARPAHRPATNFLWTKLDRWWRTFATGFSFFVFGATGLFLGAVVFPLMNLFVRDRTRLAQLARGTIAWNFRWYIGLMKGLGLLTYEFRGFEKFERDGLLVLSNHPSLIDTIFLLGFVRDRKSVV